MEKTLNEKEKEDILEYVQGRNDAIEGVLKEDNRSEAYEAGYSSGRDKIKLDNFRDWYTEYKNKN